MSHLSELSIQLNRLQSSNNAQLAEIHRLNRQVQIISDLQGVSIQEIKDALKKLNIDNATTQEIDPLEEKQLYEKHKSKLTSILYGDENLTDVQMLLAMTVAIEAANNGEEKFSTKLSLYRLNEAKIQDLQSFLNLHNKEREKARWGIGRGKLVKKLGAVFQELKERCDEIDQQKQQERKGRLLSSTEIFRAAFDDLQKQIDEYENIVKRKKMAGFVV